MGRKVIVFIHAMRIGAGQDEENYYSVNRVLNKGTSGVVVQERV